MNFFERLNKEEVIIFDGAMGTEIQKLSLSPDVWLGKTGCSEILNFTVPEKIKEIHENYLASGAEVIETNTFGANLVVLKEYGLDNKIIEINEKAALIAREAIKKFYSSERPRFVAGSMGPGTKLPSLKQITYDELYESYFLQATGLIKGKVDLFIIETCQDLLQIKACYNAVKNACKKYNYDVPIIVSVTIEQNGTMLLGTDTLAAIVVLSSIGVKIMGLNCATGPEAMAPYIKQIASYFDGEILVMPNAGLPENINGKLVYNLRPEDFANKMEEYVDKYNVKIVGGCCGTTPKHIEKLALKVKGMKVKKREIKHQPAIASLYTSQSLIQDPKPFLIAERTNANGSKKFREMLLNNEWDKIVELAKEQEKNQAHAIDLCVAYTGIDEKKMLEKAIGLLTPQLTIPVVIDSTNIEIIEAALKCYPGKPIINSINLEEGEIKAIKICELAKKYGASLIALLIDEEGMAKTVSKKLEIAKRIYNLVVEKNKIKPSDLIFDTLTFTLAAGDEESKYAGINTLEAIKRIKKEMPDVLTILGVSNISYGLKGYSREILNSVFLHEAVNAGLDLAIINVGQIIPFFKIAEEERELALDLIYNRKPDALFNFISFFEKKGGSILKNKEEENLTLDEKIKKRIVDGSKSNLEELLKEKLKENDALQIINEVLIEAMKEVGELFGKGELQLPFVLQSAEVMKYAVDILTPYIKKGKETQQKSLVLATVKGDVHDIGKNLVDIIISNNGYKVYNLGIKCDIETIYKKAKEINADAIGMSGLLVKSTQIMKENIEYLKEKDWKKPILLGGAALTPSYVLEVCAPLIETPVIYCANAFDGLKAMNAIKDGNIEDFALAERLKYTSKKIKKLEFAIDVTEEGDIKPNINKPIPPFLGNKVIESINLDEIYNFLDENVLFRVRWGYKKGNLSEEKYQELLNNEIRPIFEKLKIQVIQNKLLNPKLIYGYYECNSLNDELIIYPPENGKKEIRIKFPRQKNSPYLCIADFFNSIKNNEKDLIAFQIVTMGNKASEYSIKLYNENKYKEYLLFHGLSVELTEALANYCHKKILIELGLQKELSSSGKNVSKRFSFGYPCCPDLEGNRIIYDLLNASRIGVKLTEELQMVPEQTTSAFIVFNPSAKYFSLE